MFLHLFNNRRTERYGVDETAFLGYVSTIRVVITSTNVGRE